jgi:hypothetical protein
VDGTKLGHWSGVQRYRVQHIFGQRTLRRRRPQCRRSPVREYLSIVLAIAETRSSNGKLHPQTIGRLLTRHAAILEWMGPSQPSWFELRSQLERVWDGLHDQGIEAARAALKLGDLNHRLGDVGQGPSRSRTQTQTLPKRPKLHLQCLSHHQIPLWRTLVSTLEFLSACYATLGQLKQAQPLEESSLDVIC